MTFRLTMKDAQGVESYLFYDQHKNEIRDESGELAKMDYDERRDWSRATIFSPDQPAGKGNAPTRLKIQLGLKCNYSCSYCLQSSEIPDASVSSTADVDEFLANLDTWLRSEPGRIEFWGGEPFVYWAHLKKLVPAIREKFPKASFLIVTNGSLLSEEKIAFIERYNITVGVSHDGPGQPLRGPDPFDDERQLEAIKELLRRRPETTSINCVITAGNNDVDAITEWFYARLNMKVQVSFEGVVHSYDMNNKGDVAKWGADAYSRLQYGIVQAMVSGTDAGHKSSIAGKGVKFLESLRARRPSYAMGQKCGMDRPDQLAVDLKGNVTTCQNVGANGKHGIGHVSDMSAVSLDTSWHWSQRDNCNHCPVLQLCQGACMYSEGEDFDQSCENEFHFNSAIMAGALYWATGKMMVNIEGDIRRPKKRKVIPILAA